MAKDPAFLFYYQDFLVGTSFMNHEERGCYITILCHLADKKKLSNEHMLSICKPYAFSDVLKSKFSIDQEGYFYNKRLSLEIEKRRVYTESRRKNAKSTNKAYAQHMENENENIKENKNIEKTARFSVPTVQEIKKYCMERNNTIDPQHFFDSNQAKGWLVGKNKTPMKDWKAAIRTWENYKENTNESKQRELQ